MGIDMHIHIHGLTTPQRERIAWRIASIWGITDPIWGSTYDNATDDVVPDSVSLWTGWRYYSEDYARGPWPDIYALIRLCQHECPGQVIEYGGDDYQEPVTDELMEKHWKIWAASDYESYRWTKGPECCGGPMHHKYYENGTDLFACPKCKKEHRTARASA